MDKLPLDIIGLASSQSRPGNYVLVLGELHGSRRLPIIIGGPEAQAIALALEKIPTERPMTHDLIQNFAIYFDWQLIEVIINDLQDGVFYSKLIIESEGELHEIDCRPSDAIAISIRMEAPVFTYEDILSEAGIHMERRDKSKENIEETATEEITPLPKPKKKKTRKRKSPDSQLTSLQKELDKAIADEDYEAAARIRDEISSLNQSDEGSK